MKRSIDNRIRLVRGVRVIIDADLAVLYGVKTKALNQAVRRNARRFPADFAFRLSHKEAQKVVTNCDHLHRLRFSPVPPLAFTEHGALMAANLLNSGRAMDVSVIVVRAFVRLRRSFALHRRLFRKLAELEERVGSHDETIRDLMTAIRELMEPPPEPHREAIGFHTGRKR